jgi:hypothetical protein
MSSVKDDDVKTRDDHPSVFGHRPRVHRQDHLTRLDAIGGGLWDTEDSPTPAKPPTSRPPASPQYRQARGSRAGPPSPSETCVRLLAAPYSSLPRTGVGTRRTRRPGGDAVGAQAGPWGFRSATGSSSSGSVLPIAGTHPVSDPEGLTSRSRHRRNARRRVHEAPLNDEAPPP